MNNTLTANVALFYIKYKDLQIQSFPPAPFVTAITVNSGSATSKGFEFELDWKATQNLTVGGSYGYSDPTYGAGTIDLSLARYCGDGSLCSTDASGKSLTRTSNHTLNGSLQWEDNLMADWNYYIRRDVHYQSKQFTRSNNLQWVPARTLVNARAAVTNGPLELAVWGKNIFNRRYDVIAIAQPRYSSILNFITNLALGEGSTFGATVSYKF